jgi:hypothetical protein
MKNYYNVEKTRIYNKQYRIINKQQIIDTYKSYYKIKKESISLKNKEKIICSCGTSVRKEGIKRHQRTAQHERLMNSLELYFS